MLLEEESIGQVTPKAHPEVNNQFLLLVMRTEFWHLWIKISHSQEKG